MFNRSIQWHCYASETIDHCWEDALSTTKGKIEETDRQHWVPYEPRGAIHLNMSKFFMQKKMLSLVSLDKNTQSSPMTTIQNLCCHYLLSSHKQIRGKVNHNKQSWRRHTMRFIYRGRRHPLPPFRRLGERVEADPDIPLGVTHVFIDGSIDAVSILA